MVADRGSPKEETSSEIRDDDPEQVRAYLKRAADEFKDINERIAVLSKQYEESISSKRNAARKKRLSSDLPVETIEDGDFGEKLNEEAKGFMEGYDKNKQVDDLLKKHADLSYLAIIRRVRDLATQLKSSLEKGDWKNFTQLLSKELDDNLARRLIKCSNCKHLCGWIIRQSWNWKKQGCDHISRVISDRLEQANVPRDVLHADQRLLDEIQPLVQGLLDLTSFKSKEQERCAIVASAILRPFMKRFIYNFGNNSDQSGSIKSEWYLSIVIKWHRQFAPWFEKLKLEMKSDNSTEPAIILATLPLFFTRGLVDLARRRFKADLLKAAHDHPNSLPHLIDEAISFDNDMKTSGYPERDLGCVDILIEPGVFEMWTKLEQQEAEKCLDAFFNDPEAWLLRYGDNVHSPDQGESLDSHKVPSVTDKVLVLLTAMKYRFRFVHSHEHRRIFIQIQCTILHNFRDNLSELSHELGSPIASMSGNKKTKKSSPTFAHLVNSCSYVCSVLTEWQETPTYLAIRTACFEDIIDLFDHTKRTLMRDACSAVLRELESNVDEYRRSFAFYTGRGDVNFAGQATPHLYTPVREALSILHQTLNQRNFTIFARQLAVGLDKTLIESVVLQLRLDQKSGEELQRHLGTIFIKVTFKNYGVLGAAAYFTRLSQFLHVASMNAGNCMLLKEALKEQKMPVEHILGEMGLEQMKPDEAEDMLQRRSDLI